MILVYTCEIDISIYIVNYWIGYDLDVKLADLIGYDIDLRGERNRENTTPKSRVVQIIQ